MKLWQLRSHDRKGPGALRARPSMLLDSADGLLLLVLPIVLAHLLQRVHKLGHIGVVAVAIRLVVAAFEQRFERAAHTLILFGAPAAFEAQHILGAPNVLGQWLGALVAVFAAAGQLAHDILDQRAALLDA